MAAQSKQPGKPPTPSFQSRSERLFASTAFEVVPRGINLGAPDDLPRWRVRFELLSDPNKAFGLEIYDDVTLGRDMRGPEYVDLSFFDAALQGVSREHAMLRPAGDKLFVIDLGSTNGTRRSGHELSAQTPYALRNGEVLALGTLRFTVLIAERPRGVTSISKKADLADALTETAKALTSSLELDQILEQVADAAMFLTSAGATAVWLLDDKTRELRLEAQRGFQDNSQSMAVLAPDNPFISQVLAYGDPVRVGERHDEQSIKVKTDFLVEALLLVPISLGGITIGILGAFQHTPNRDFDERDERLLISITDFAAIAVQNARHYQTTDQALNKRVQEMAAVNELSAALSTSLDLDYIHDVLVSQLCKHWAVEEVILWLQDENSGDFNPLLDKEQVRQLVERSSDQVFKIVESVVESGEPLISDFREIRETEAKTRTLKMQGMDIACVPLKIQGKVTGVIILLHTAQGTFNQDDLILLQAFANPVASAIQNAQLYAQSQREQAIINATAQTLPQPLMILSDEAELIVANAAAQELLDTHKVKLFEAITSAAGQTSELEFDEETYLTTVQRIPEVGTIIIMQNITGLKQLDEARLEFVHALSHDLKNPLASIIGYADLVPRVDELSERGLKYIQSVVKTAHNMNDMIIKLLDVALLTETPQKKHEPCDLDAIVQGVVANANGAALARSIDMTYKLVGKPYEIEGDESRLYRSVLNLVDNAIKYSPENTKVQVGVAFQKEQVNIIVQDDGPGIPEEDIERLFDRFYRGKQANERKVGYGLGLVMVRATAQEHGGNVMVENVAGHGARFTITIPANL